jgi:hypothetical protein
VLCDKHRNFMEMNNNPLPGNKLGGLTTMLENRDQSGSYPKPAATRVLSASTVMIVLPCLPGL